MEFFLIPQYGFQIDVINFWPVRCCPVIAAQMMGEMWKEVLEVFIRVCGGFSCIYVSIECRCERRKVIMLVWVCRFEILREFFLLECEKIENSLFFWFTECRLVYCFMRLYFFENFNSHADFVFGKSPNWNNRVDQRIVVEDSSFFSIRRFNVTFDFHR